MENLAPANIYRSKLTLQPGLNYHSTLKDRSLILVVQTSQMSLKLEFGFRRIETYGEIQNKEFVSCLRLIRNWMTNHVKYGIRGLKRMLNRFFFFVTFYSLTQLVELQHGATVTLLVVAFCILLHSCYGERLLQGQHDLVHLREQNKLRQPKLSISFVKQKPHQILTNVQRCQATLLLRVYCNAVSKWGHKDTVFVQSWTFLIYRFFSNVVWMQTIISLTSSIFFFFYTSNSTAPNHTDELLSQM